MALEQKSKTQNQRLLCVNDLSRKLDYVLKILAIRVKRGILSMFEQPARKLLTPVGIAGKTLLLLIPKLTGRARNFHVIFHFASVVMSIQTDLSLMNSN
jgi:hypothetical protein